MGIENRYEEPDLDIEFVEIDKNLRRSPEKREGTLEVGSNVGRNQASFLRRDEETETKLKEKAAERIETAIAEDAPLIVPTFEVREGDEDGEPRDVSLDQFKRPATKTEEVSENFGSNMLILGGVGAMLFVCVLLFVVAKLI